MDKNVKVFVKSPNERAQKGSFVFWLFVAVLVLCDQLSKYFFVRFFPANQPFLILRWFGVEVFNNSRFAFSLPVPEVLMYFIYAVILAGIIYYIARNYHGFNLAASVAWTFIVAGAVCNIFERIVLGYVRDFIFIFNGIFNFADFYIIAGIIVLLIAYQNDKY